MVQASFLKEVQRKKRILDIETSDIENEQKIKGSSQKHIKKMYLERERDFLRFHDKPGCRLLLACEAETKANYVMPVRCFTYDGVEYTDQLKGQKELQFYKKRQVKQPLIPVFHLVLYLGEKRWIRKQRLQEMMKIPVEVQEFSEKLPEYDIGLIDIHEQDPELFRTEWRDIFKLMRYSRKKEELRKYVEENKEEIQKLSMETRWFLGILLEQYSIMDDNSVEVRDVCKAWDGAMQMYADEARQETRKEMKKEMREQKRQMKLKMKEKLKEQEVAQNKKTVYNMLLKGYPQEEIAAILEQPLTKVKKWCEGFAGESGMKMA